MYVVEIEKPENEPLSVWFSTLRDWLDRNRCVPAVFTRSGRRIDRLIYRISFDDPVLAKRFSAHFAQYLPVTRRATRLEREEIRALAEAAASQAAVAAEN